MPFNKKQIKAHIKFLKSMIEGCNINSETAFNPIDVRKICEKSLEIIKQLNKKQGL